MSEVDKANRLVSKTARALARSGDGAGFAAVAVELPDGQRAVAWAIDQGTSDDLLMAAIALLKRVEEDAALGALTCGGCADRWSRARTALAALRVEGSTPEHLH